MQRNGQWEVLLVVGSLFKSLGEVRARLVKNANEQVTVKRTLAMSVKLISDMAKADFIVTCS